MGTMSNEQCAKSVYCAEIINLGVDLANVFWFIYVYLYCI
jgi:hypothetical protein